MAARPSACSLLGQAGVVPMLGELDFFQGVSCSLPNAREQRRALNRVAGGMCGTCGKGRAFNVSRELYGGM